jgi:hypothetical protein
MPSRCWYGRFAIANRLHHVYTRFYMAALNRACHYGKTASMNNSIVYMQNSIMSNSFYLTYFKLYVIFAVLYRVT